VVRDRSDTLVEIEVITTMLTATSIEITTVRW
jgi:hypothetical protein